MTHIKPPCYLIDSSIYVFRAWFALPDSLVDVDNNPINAVYGFTEFVYQLLQKTRPQHIAFAFDESLKTSFRKDIYPDYKANRKSAPDELKKQFQYCRAFIKALGIVEIASDSYEADDVIGTLAERMRHQDHPIILVTGDKDLTQLVHENDLWWEFSKDKKLDSKGIKKAFGVRPDQIVDLLGITGDKVDNIPGVPGVGIKTAARLLTKHDSIENLLNNIQRIGEMKFRGAKRIQQLINDHQDTIRLAQKLTKIELNADIPETGSLMPNKPNEDNLASLFDQFQFSQGRRNRWTKLLGSL